MPRKKVTHPDRCNITDVAIRLKLRYHKARDLVLSGKLGEPVPDERDRLTVLTADVVAYALARQAKAKAQPQEV